jgi:hypothetical protein
MSTTDRIPVVVYDDGTPTGAIAMQRALDVASRIVLAVADRSPNHTANVTAADRAGVPVEVVNLAADTGIRHALALCAEHDIYFAYVPAPAAHPGEQLRKIVQAAAHAEAAGLPVLAVRVVHPDAPSAGPVVEIDPAHADTGFVALLAAGLAATTGRPLHIVRLAGDRSNADTRSEDALQQARELIAADDIAVYDQSDEGDPLSTAAQYAHGASAVVLGIGGLTVHGRNPIRPDELPNSVLRTADGELAHHVARESATDLIVVCDTITLHHGRASQVAAVAAAGAAIVGGTIAAGAVGLVAATAAIALGGAAAVGRR